MKKSISKRIRITKSGKVIRRAMALGHSKANKTGFQKNRKKRGRGLNIPKKILKNYQAFA